MSAEPAQRSIPEPGELVYQPRPSWAPAFFALGVTLAVCGTFTSFMLPGWFYSIAGAVILLGFLRTMVRGAVRDYFRLPRKQKVRGAVLPVETLSPPK
ncbi:MAG: hypothetical protein WD827_07460 [Solirubrobacterales bacterium]